MNKMKPILVIPMYNEELLIEGTIKSIKNAVDINILIVNDGSKDRSPQIVKRMDVTLIDRKQNLGYDYTLQEGIIWALNNGFDYIITFDADGQHDPKDILRVLKYLEKYEIVSCVRPKKQRFSEYILEFYTKNRFRILDPLCGLKGYRKDFFGKFGLLIDYPAIGMQWLYFGLLMGAKVKQIGINLRERKGQSTFGIGWKPNYRILKSMILLMKLNKKMFD